MPDSLRRMPAGFAPRAWLEPLPPAARFILRGDAEVRAAASRAVGVELADGACRAASCGERAALWLGPDELLLLAPERDAAALAAALGAAIAGSACSLVDVSHRQLAVTVHGPHAAWLLTSGCPLDLDASAFPVDMCTRTVFHKAEILLWRIAPDAFRLEVWRSFADYVVELLAEAALEVPA